MVQRRGVGVVATVATTMDSLGMTGAEHIEVLLHTMHDAAKFADGTTLAILEGVLHAESYGGRIGPYRGNKCTCPFCAEKYRPFDYARRVR